MANRIMLEILADNNPLLRSLDQAQRHIDKFADASAMAGHALGSGVNEALNVFAGLAAGGATAAGVLAGGLVAAGVAATTTTLAVAKHVETIDQLSQKTGLATQTIQGWSVIMAENGFQAESLTTGMRTLSKQIVDAHDPASRAASLFEGMGISITALGSTESTIRALADKFKALPDGPDKARLAVELFGKAGLDLIPLLNRGSAAFDASRQAAERYGLVLSTDQVQALNAADDATDRLGQSMQGLTQTMAAAFAPTVASTIERLTQAVVSARTAVASLNGAMKTGEPKTAQEFLGQSIVEKTLADLAEAEQAEGDFQESLGHMIGRVNEKHKRALEVAGHAEEALGKTQLAIIQRVSKEQNLAFAQQVEQEEALQRFHEGLGQGNMKASGAFVDSVRAREQAVDNLLNLMPELNRQEAMLMAANQSEKGLRILQESQAAYLHRNDALDDAISLTKAVDDAQQALYAQERAAIGASDVARRVRFSLIDAEADRERQRIEETILNAERKTLLLQALDNQTEAKRRAAIQQFPSFFEQQMQAIVGSNAFSMGSMVSTWTNGIAQMVVHGGNLKAAWEQTQVALVQAVLNSGVQMLAQATISASQEIALKFTTESTKTTLAAAAAGERVAIAAQEQAAVTGLVEGSNTTIIASMTAAGKAVQGIGGVVMTALSGIVDTVTTILDAVGDALSLTGILAPLGIGIKLLSTGLKLFSGGGLGELSAVLGGMDVGFLNNIQEFFGFSSMVNLDAIPSVGFATGGIGDFGAGTKATLHGPEAIIPLNARGAAFMREVFGRAGNSRGVGDVYLDGQKVGEIIERAIRRRVYLEGAL